MINNFFFELGALLVCRVPELTGAGIGLLGNSFIAFSWYRRGKRDGRLEAWREAGKILGKYTLETNDYIESLKRQIDNDSSEAWKQGKKDGI